ncbi:MAG: bacterial transcriptional activator domain-containing protein, partial [Lachnospiraceae bacterium]|nr:bacterial transcriptional activator domain-containing protein [Lachnospiraceae bacterium]
MDVQSLIELLEPYKDKQMAKDYKIEIEDDKVVLKVAKRKVAQKKADIMKTVVQKIEDKVHYYNFKEFAYAFEHFCHQFGYMYVTKLPIDQVTVCQHAVSIDPYEETLHYELIKAMLETGAQQTALNHY